MPFLLQLKKEIATLLELKRNLGDDSSKQKFVLKTPKVCKFDAGILLLSTVLFVSNIICVQQITHVNIFVRVIALVRNLRCEPDQIGKRSKKDESHSSSCKSKTQFNQCWVANGGSLCLPHSLHQIKLTKVFFAHCLVISYFRLAVLLKSR